MRLQTARLVLRPPREQRQERVERWQVVEGLRPLLELPVELVLATHGGPHDRAALERVFVSS